MTHQQAYEKLLTAFQNLEGGKQEIVTKIGELSAKIDELKQNGELTDEQAALVDKIAGLSKEITDIIPDPQTLPPSDQIQGGGAATGIDEHPDAAAAAAAGSTPAGGAPAPEEVDLDAMTKAELLEHAESKNIEVSSSATKAEIVEAIESAK